MKLTNLSLNIQKTLQKKRKNRTLLKNKLKELEGNLNTVDKIQSNGT